MSARATILGCGSSGGVPRLGGEWGACDPNNKKNIRTRCALLLEGEYSTVVIDAGPDFRTQMLNANVSMIDALVLTHEHADHLHGIDDIRQFVNAKTAKKIAERNPQSAEISREDFFTEFEKSRINAFAGLTCVDALHQRFSYLFERPEGSVYPPIMKLNIITSNFTPPNTEFTFIPFALPHGSIDAFGFKIGNLAYLPDFWELTPEAEKILATTDIWILDCLQYKPHGTHSHFERTMAYINTHNPKKAILTNLHNSLDYEELSAKLPKNVSVAYDGKQIDFENNISSNH